MNMTLFRDVHDRADEQGVISMDVLADQAARRWDYSVAHNPDFYYGPVTGMVSRNAGYFFLGRLLSNHTAEHPEGILTQKIFQSFFGVFENDRGDLEYRKGHETIPENWYRTSSEYGLVSLNLDILGWIRKHPVLGRYVVSSLFHQSLYMTNTDTMMIASGVIPARSTHSPASICKTSPVVS
jgi:hypothetical protein